MDKKTDIKRITEQAQTLMGRIIKEEVQEKHWVTHYGANYIHPRHLVYWICVQSDKEKERLEKDTELMKRLRNTLYEVNYPEEARDLVHIGFESQETVDRESKGHWWYHWK